MATTYINHYYFASKIVSMIREKLKMAGIDRLSVEYALDKLKIPFIRSDKGYRLYVKWYIDTLVHDSSKINKVKSYIEEFNHTEKFVDNDTIAKKRNRDEMIRYLNKIIDNPKSSSMEDASKELLMNDDIYYNGKVEEEQLSDVEGDWKPKEGIFTEKSPRKIANYLLKHSKDKGQAMKRLVFYMNRSGENLTNKTVLNQVKKLLQEGKKITINEKIKKINESYSRKLTINQKMKML